MLSVVFATRNRAASLPRVLDAFAALISPPGGWRLLVVDNGSTDATVATLADYTKHLPLTLLECPRPGKNRALNTAIPYLAGDLSVWTDDDVLPDRDWLVRLREAADRHPEASLFGGTVLPEWPDSMPVWLTEHCVEFSVLYAKNERASGPCSFEHIFGPNMAIRRSIFDGGICFAEDVGPDATKPLYAMGSETELLRRLHGLGHRGWFEASARVRHIVRPEQVQERWILDRAYRYGAGEGSKHALTQWGGRLTIIGLPAALLLRLAAYRMAASLAGLLAPSPRRLRIRYRDRYLAGILAGRRMIDQSRTVPPGQRGADLAAARKHQTAAAP
jgi:glucosyl-dolichyl phosphate glucuronosyltransferase